MNRLEQLKVDAVLATSHPEDGAKEAGERVAAVLDEFIARHEVVEVMEHRNGHDLCLKGCPAHPMWHATDAWPRKRTIIVPRKQEHKPTDAERLAHLEDEVHERCGSLGRRVSLLEYRTGAKVGGRPVESPLLEAAEEARDALDSLDMPTQKAAWAKHHLARAIKRARDGDE
jgi:hypothetical protein